MASGGDRVASAGGLADELLERDPVSVQEGRALGLTVVGEHDQPVGPRRVAGGRGDPRDLPVAPAQRQQGLRTLDPRVMGDLVVREERGVRDRAPGVHVGDHGRDLEIALDHRRPCAHQRVDEPALDPRLHVEPALLRRAR
jgi:hypothetical protein